MILLAILVLGAGGGYYVHHVNQQAKIAKVQREKKAAAKKAAQQKAKISRQVNQQQFSKSTGANEQITKTLKQVHFVGTALVVKNNRVMYQKGFGYADKGSNQLNGPASKYQILSIQKSFTAIGIMQLVQAGKMKLTDPITKYYPTIKSGRETTIRQLLDMTTGYRLNDGSKDTLAESQIVNYAVDHLDYYPDKDGRFNYSSVNFLLLAGIIRKVTGKSYQDFFTKNIIEKLDLKHTGFVIKGLGSNATLGYQQASASQVEPTYDREASESTSEMANELGTGQVYMSAGDLFKAESAILKGQLLSKKSVAILHTPTATGHYGGGIYNLDDGVRSHGIGYGYESDVHLSPDGKTGFVLLSNYYRDSASIESAANKMFVGLMNGQLK